jgi:hypothetical protein
LGVAGVGVGLGVADVGDGLGVTDVGVGLGLSEFSDLLCHSDRGRFTAYSKSIGTNSTFQG